MLDTYNTSLQQYFADWQVLEKHVTDKDLFASLQPVAIGWKVADRAEYDRLFAELHDACDMIVDKWMNGRWIAKMHLKDTSLDHGISIIKLMQRRPGSGDKTGLDHVDFYSPDVTDSSLEAETKFRWSREENDILDDYHWLSIWFADTEAKLKSSTVIDNVVVELSQINQKIKSAKTK